MSLQPDELMSWFRFFWKISAVRLGGALGTMRVGDMSVGMPGAHEGLIGTIAKGLIT